MVEKLLWVAKGGKTDIEPAILFLCTGVKKITKKYRGKLRQVLQYLKHTIDNKRIMGAYILIQFFTEVDAAYGVHPNLKSTMADYCLLDMG